MTSTPDNECGQAAAEGVVRVCLGWRRGRGCTRERGTAPRLRASGGWPGPAPQLAAATVANTRARLALALTQGLEALVFGSTFLFSISSISALYHGLSSSGLGFKFFLCCFFRGKAR